MEDRSPLQCPSSITVRRNPHRRARITPLNTAIDAPKNLNNVPSFPLNDILSMNVELQQNPKISSPKPSTSSDSLNVFLRVRPLPIPPPKLKQVKVKKPNKSCLTVNDSHSVTVSPPICDSNRLKSEVYNGFSQVFSSDSSQDEVYEKMMRPMVEEFLNGRSGLLAALGPSGSGKTHTVFGSIKEPGLVPHALCQIFEADKGKPSRMSRLFYFSIFEIYSEKGKGEKLSDLSPEGSNIHMQQSVVKGLKEVLVKDVAQAESLLAHAKSKRVTTMTNSNSQSSRSQCIITIRCVADEAEGESESVHSEAMLTFVDLAGAEREKKTGNKGERLLESNFINNTSMVFGLCLRSLLEHQRNPKKPLQKHFQSSLLTRYLRDYLEGRKRMSLILTVRSGEEEYFDTSSLLRQASPFMEIKFRDMEETSNLPRNKRHRQIIGNVKHKRAKFSAAEARDDNGMSCQDSENFPKEISGGNKRNHVSRAGENSLPEVKSTDSNKREYYVLQGFAKALWAVLKQYKERVKNMQKDIDALTECLRIEREQNLEMENELCNLKSQFSVQGLIPNPPECSISECDTSNVLWEKDMHFEGEPGDALTPEAVCPSTDSQERPVGALDSKEESRSRSTKYGSEEHLEPGSTNVSKDQLENFSSGPKSFLSADESIKPDVTLTKASHGAARSPSKFKMSSPKCCRVQQSPMECQISHDTSKNDCHEKDQRKEGGEESTGAAARLPRSPLMDLIVQGESCGCDTPNEKDKKNVASSPGRNINSEQETKEISHPKPSRAGRPKRRLMPASSLLLRDAGNIDMEEENVKLRGGRRGQNLVEDEHKQTKGNAHLLRLLKNHLPR